jgi:hypothetical protein
LNFGESDFETARSPNQRHGPVKPTPSILSV